MISGNRIASYPDPMRWLDGNVWAIHEDQGGTFWFATDHGLVWQRGAQYGRYTTADGLVHDRVRALLRGREGQLWVGTSRGLSRLQDGRFTSYTERDGLVGNDVRALSEDDSALWIGTYDGGLYRLAGDRLTRYTTRDGMHDNGVFQILDDGRGHFWMGSNRGIARVSQADLREFAEGRLGAVRAARFGVIDGLTTLECNGGRQPSGLRMPDGTLWLPTQGGIAQVSPALVRANPYPPPVRIEDIRVSGTSMVPGDAGIEVPPHRNSFEADYTALSLVKSDQVRFKYRLVGLDEDWVDAGSRRTAAYHGIPPGRYTFQVIAANSDGVWNTDGHAMGIVVLAPIWRQGWFLWLLTAIAVTAVVAVDRRRIGRLRREHARQRAYARQLLDTQEQERRRISNELHDSLGQTLFMIRQRARTPDGAVAGGQDEDPLDAIDHLASRAYEEMKEIAYNLRPYHLDKIGLTRTIEGMVRRVSGACGLEITADLDNVDDLFSADAQIDVYRIIQEGVSNMVRHAAATEASVSIRRHAQGAELRIRDNGVGFAPDEERQGMNGPGHVGLTNLRERARTLNGVVTIHSRPGHGTTLLVRVPGGPDDGR